tara:strand:+ start:665 stop:1636 length:972 start_codon:yes stop_codon:yes gene_type:complete
MTNKNIKNSYLFPPIEPYKQTILDVGDGHHLYVEECGNPSGIPIMVLHGGPGGGCSPLMRRYFDPKNYRIILFDQRGCGKSRPFASVKDNNTWKLIEDIKKIKNNLLIDKFILFGGSWGAALSLLYSINYPEQILFLILRGVFTMSKPELEWFYFRNGASKFWPEAWERFESIIPEKERSDLILAYNKRLFSSSPVEQEKFSKAWTSWENTLASFESKGMGYTSSTEYAKAFARIENHYFLNNCFLNEENQIIPNLHKIKNIPSTIVQGRYDMITPLSIAFDVHKQLPKSKLIIIPKAGHAMSEKGIQEELINTTEKVKKYFS